MPSIHHDLRLPDVHVIHVHPKRWDIVLFRLTILPGLELERKHATLSERLDGFETRSLHTPCAGRESSLARLFMSSESCVYCGC